MAQSEITVETYDATAKPKDLLAGKIAYAKGQEIVGTIQSKEGGTFVPGRSSKVVCPKWKYVTSDINIAGDTNLKPENIKNGVTIFGVKGTSKGAPPPDKLPDGFYKITVNSDPEGACANTGEGVASYGANITLDAEPSERIYEFSQWKENNAILSADKEYSFLVKANRDLTAKFSVLPHNTITVSVSPKDYGSVSGSGKYLKSESVTIEATPASKKHLFAEWKENGQSLGNTNPYTFTPNGDMDITAIFEFDNSLYWEATTLPSFNYQGIVYGNGKFVSIAKSALRSIYSSDGINWETTNFPFNTSSCAIQYAGEKFFAIPYLSGGQDDIAYSEDGINWNASKLPSSRRWSKVVYGNGRYIAFAPGHFDNGILAYSNDGITWLETSIGTYGRWANIIYSSGKFIVITDTSVTQSSKTDHYAYSEDGINWNIGIFPIRDNWYSIAYGNGKFVVTASASQNVLYSDNGVDWNTSTLPAMTYVYGSSLIFCHDRFFELSSNLASSSSNYEKVINYSEDGIEWISLTLPLAIQRAIIYGDGKFIIPTGSSKYFYSSDIALYSEDCVIWKQSKLPNSGKWGCAYANGKFVAINETSIGKGAYSL